ncbi:hypothetical protein [Mesorhizobium sp. AA23]|uniref:hypothetical protein n=1 Tax=Mesorhizobium sp. AA23 TaxID=1854058 RepID=UPI0008019765|nr:hypothetical protein [Mesorhizobium sp. AA23]OBQ94162.1 hypothetical protein A9K66_27985 [Mesorhizobium sp. AA23]
MLSRTKAPTSPDFSKSLVIPERSASIAKAEEALQKAVAAREEGQARHIEAGRRLANQPLGQPPTISQRDVDEIGATLQPLFDAEKEARAVRDEEVRLFEMSIGPSLAEPLAAYRQAVGEALDTLEGLLRQGAAFAAKARQARFDLKPHSRLPGVAEQMGDRLQFVRQPFERT